jgi:hypothetical protein
MSRTQSTQSTHSPYSIQHTTQSSIAPAHQRHRGAQQRSSTHDTTAHHAVTLYSPLLVRFHVCFCFVQYAQMSAQLLSGKLAVRRLTKQRDAALLDVCCCVLCYVLCLCCCALFVLLCVAVPSVCCYAAVLLYCCAVCPSVLLCSLCAAVLCAQCPLPCAICCL